MLDARSLLRQYNLFPRKSLGQNFLVDPTAPSRIADCAELNDKLTVLEIGAGLGTLTCALALRSHRVVAVETDPTLVAVLQHELAEHPNISIVEGDILKLNPAELLGTVPEGPHSPLWGTLLPDYVVVANLPYYITAAVIRHVLESSVRPRRMVITVQREVALRMIAQPDDMSLLSVSVQLYSQPRIMMRLKRGAFHPAPNVESAVVRLDLYDNPPVAVESIPLFFKIVRAGFGQKRKQLRNSLAAGLSLQPLIIEESLDACGIDYRRRAETLSLVDWSTVVHSLRPYTEPAISHEVP